MRHQHEFCSGMISQPDGLYIISVWAMYWNRSVLHVRIPLKHIIRLKECLFSYVVFVYRLAVSVIREISIGMTLFNKSKFFGKYKSRDNLEASPAQFPPVTSEQLEKFHSTPKRTKSSRITRNAANRLEDRLLSYFVMKYSSLCVGSSITSPKSRSRDGTADYRLVID